MTLGLLVGVAFGAAVCLLVYALAPPRPQLAVQVERWERQRARPAASADESSVEAPIRLVGQRLVALLARHGVDMTSTRVNLALLEETMETHLVRKFGYGLLGLVAPSMFSAMAIAAGVTPPVMVPLVGGLVLGAVFFVVPDLALTQRAGERRDELRRALACYLDLVAMSLAGGQGAPQALPAAARIGTGWAFELIEDTIMRARYSGSTPWAALADLGKRTGMPELEDLGGSLTLVAHASAKVRLSLTSRAESQRKRQLAEAEAAAEKADDSIRVAHMLLGVGFFMFLIYPAVINVLST